MTDDATTAPRRLRAGDVIDNLQETIRRLTERHSSSVPSATIDFTRNAKGETQIAVKVSANADADREALPAFLDAIYRDSLAVYETACRRFPTASGTATNDPPPKAEK